MNNDKKNSLLKKLSDFSEPNALISCGFYSGLSPFASGTSGSAAALIIWWLLFKLQLIDSVTNQIILFVIITLIGLYTTARFLKSDLNKSISSRKQGDPGVVVIDEWSGMMLTLINGVGDSWIYLGLCFFFFRLFDVLKPGPVDTLQKLPGTWGVMLDDVGAGLIALLVMQAIKLLFFA
jgi:phosphatidylglycerophosphatase A